MQKTKNKETPVAHHPTLLPLIPGQNILIVWKVSNLTVVYLGMDSGSVLLLEPDSPTLTRTIFGTTQRNRVGFSLWPELDAYSTAISATSAGDQDQSFHIPAFLCWPPFLNTNAPIQWSIPHWIISAKAVISAVVTFLSEERVSLKLAHHLIFLSGIKSQLIIGIKICRESVL